ncbi:hypothetical protein [Nocardia testacea]|uniref:hypothetical protein n=1 Tax=Nocardia testacea TaxID=248551 RepID=UPI000A30FBB2
MTRAALAKAAALSPGLIQKIEQGSRTTTLDALSALFRGTVRATDPVRSHHQPHTSDPPQCLAQR